MINPVAIFDPVELEGTTVSRASVHNISIMETFKLGIGDTILIFKANMIIPQIAENLTRSNQIEIPKKCPVCGEQTKIQQENNVKFLYCINEECLAKKIKSLTHFVSRDAMNIEGLSEATIEKFLERGFLKELADLFHLKQYKEEIIEMDGFGEKSYENLILSVEKARTTSIASFIYSLGIPNIGLSNAKLIAKEFDNDFERIENADKESLINVSGVGEIIAESFTNFFQNKSNRMNIHHLLKELIFIQEEREENDIEKILSNMTFVITGSIKYFKNRKEIKEIIENKGGKVTETVTSKTTYLINNNNSSNSSKNKKAKEIGIPIITEEEFIDKFKIKDKE